MLKRHQVVAREGKVVVQCASYLKVDQSYQREADLHRVEQIAAAWDPAQAREVMVSRRKDGDYIMNGQHTAAAAVKRFGKEFQIRCLVFEGLSIKDEAELFYKQHQLEQHVTALGLYKARLVAEEPVACAIAAITARCGLRVSSHVATDALTAVLALEHTQRKFGTLERALMILKLAWGDRGSRVVVGDVKPRKSRDGEGAYAAILIKSMGCFLHAYPNADDDRIVAQLKPCHPAEILANIKLKHKTEGGTSEVNGAICIRTKYNSRLQSDRVLPLDKLVR